MRAHFVLCNDPVSSFEELSRKDNSYTIHMLNIQALGIELYKVANGISPKIMSLVFPLKTTRDTHLKISSKLVT